MARLLHPRFPVTAIQSAPALVIIADGLHCSCLVKIKICRIFSKSSNLTLFTHEEW